MTKCYASLLFLAVFVVAGALRAQTPALGPVRINELVADNETGPTDEEGKFEDWIELYNDSDARVDLSGYGISDDPERPQRYVFPDGVAIGPRAYLIVWADDDQDDGPLHTNFNLSKDGERLSLVDRSGATVDSVTFPQLGADLAYARQPDGTGAWKITAPTFGVSNGDPSRVREPAAFPDARLYPNPSSGGEVSVSLPRAGLELSLYDPLGRRVWQQVNASLQANVPNAELAVGLYVLTVRGEEGVRHLHFVRQ